MSDPTDARRLLETLATHPVLPPAELLPASDETLHAVLAELTRGERSTRAGVLREVAQEHAISIEELARRAEFLLACLVLPASGTHYEVLGVSPSATTEEVRKRWASLIQRYHPDHLGGGGGLDSQARRLIEAYQTLKDPERRRQYDARLPGQTIEVPPVVTVNPRRVATPARRPIRWRWAPVGIVAIGLAVGVWAYTKRPVGPPPSSPLPAAPKLLETWGVGQAKPEGSQSVRPRERAPVETSPGPVRRAESGEPVPLPSLQERLAAVPAPPALALPIPLPGPPPKPAASAPVADSAATPTSESLPSPSAAASGSAGAAARPSVAGPARPPEPPRAPVPPAAPAPSGPSGARSVAAPPDPGGHSAPPAPLVRSAEPARPPTPGATTAAGAAGAAPPAVAARPNPGAASPPPSPASTQAVAWPPMIRETLALIEAFRGAYERKDLRAMLELFGAEPRDRGVAGRAAIEQLYARNFAALGHVSYELTQLEVHMATAENDIIVHGRYRIRATRLGSPPLDVAGRIGWALRRESGGLRIARIDYEIVPTASAAAGTPVTAASVTGRSETGLPPGVTVHTVPRAEILAVIEDFRGAYERKDLRGMMGLLGSEPRDRNVRGRGALEQLYIRNFAALDQIRYELTQLELHPSTGEADLVVEGRYRVRAIRVASPSQPLDVAGPIRWLLRRELGALRIVGIDYDVSVR